MTHDISPDDLDWLFSPETAPWFTQVRQSGQRSDTTKLVAQLRKQLSPERTHLLLQQVALRDRAKAKFPQPDAMFFTPLGLEQATDYWTACYKANRFASAFGAGCVADLCCGIGGDLIALAERGPVVGVDRDVMTARCAAANLRAVADKNKKHGATVECMDFHDINLKRFTALHIDPDRRPDADHRTTRPEMHEPSLDTIRRLADICPNVCIKLAPAAELLDDWQAESELEWISRQGQCRQLAVWRGELTQEPGRRRATKINITQDENAVNDTKILSYTYSGDPDVLARPGDAIARYIYEPDPAVLAAQLWGDLANKLDLTAPNASIPYLTSDMLVDHPLLAAFEIEDLLPLDRKRLRRLLQDREIGRLEIKKRGVDVQPEKLRSQLKLKGDCLATLLIWPVAGQTTVAIARRCR